MPNTFRVGQRVTHRDNNLMRGFVKRVGADDYDVLWDFHTYLNIVQPQEILPVEFGMGSKLVSDGGESIRVLADTGDTRVVERNGATDVYSISEIRINGWREADAEVKEEWPKIGSQYWRVIGNGTVEVLGWTDDVCDRQYLAIGNVFRDKASAQAAAERVKAALKNV